MACRVNEVLLSVTSERSRRLRPPGLSSGSGRKAYSCEWPANCGSSGHPDAGRLIPLGVAVARHAGARGDELGRYRRPLKDLAAASGLQLEWGKSKKICNAK